MHLLCPTLGLISLIYLTSGIVHAQESAAASSQPVDRKLTPRQTPKPPRRVQSGFPTALLRDDAVRSTQLEIIPLEETAILYDPRLSRSWLLIRASNGDPLWVPIRKLETLGEYERWKRQTEKRDDHSPRPDLGLSNQNQPEPANPMPGDHPVSLSGISRNADVSRYRAKTGIGAEVVIMPRLPPGLPLIERSAPPWRGGAWGSRDPARPEPLKR